MSDRPGFREPDTNDDDDLAYLDAGLNEVDSSRASQPEPIATSPHRQETAETPSVVVTSPLVRERNWTWPLINFGGLLVVIALGFLANALEFNGQTTGDVLRAEATPFQPEAWVFAIWVVIYAMLLVFTIYGLLPAVRRNVRLQRISPLFLIANIANVTWLVLWHYERFLASLIAILILLGALLGIFIGLRITNPLRRSAAAEKPGWFWRLVMWAPFSVYLGWICVAALANLMIWMDHSGWDGGPFSNNVWAVILIVAGTLIAAVFAFTAKDVLIPIVFAVAFVGIAHHNWREAALVSVVAIVFAVFCVGLAGVGSVIAFDRNADRGFFGRGPTAISSTSETRVDDPPPKRA